MKHFIKTHRNLLIGVIIALLLLGTWAYFAGGARQQSSFRRTDERVSQAKTLLKSAFAGSRYDRLKAIASLAELKQNDTCHGDWWNDWQQDLVSTIKTAAEQCRSKEQHLEKVILAAAAIRRYNTDDTAISKQLSELKVDTTAPDWPVKAKAAAIRAAQAINAIRAISEAKPVQKTAKARVEAIISAWNSLNTASSKQDKDAYLAAESELKQAYADLAAISDVSDAQLSKLLDHLSKAAKTL